ncbi:imidazole glycerol phosphate synthase subunit HisH [Epidermidibacterium keratini]|uniref:Imidazole glycerol phosphate synthase subunit HisH n=1 Tax=Epidermidibacterium keratini TaxID=1891644 RepID=A0A7L4YKP4_9ACTN|nr:imidazole glycerol phosphate synthase subunit HisH [Epidermidibacterium keratini]QHB99116.1 imidazole glycerol phosphate synthase subunit HisH [Epidermidibacterium keratini]
MSNDVVVLDYGFGNIRSAHRALERAGAQVEVTADLERAAACDGLVVPGVGAFAACMAGIDQIGARELIAERVRAERPVLGICVGAQIMFAGGTEHGQHSTGIGVVPGEVTELHAPIRPHMGWNTVAAHPDSVLHRGLDADTRFYFVHSYAATATDPQVRVSTCEYGERFIASFEYAGLCATQFHPEKSGDAGAELLANWMRLL